MREIPYQMEQRLLGIPQAAQLLGISKHTVRLWIKKGRLPFIQLGRRILLRADDLHAFIEKNRKICEPGKLGKPGDSNFPISG